MWKCGPLRAAIVRGETQQIAGWRITPIALALALTRRHAVIGETSVHAEGIGWATLQPLAVAASREGRTRLHPTPDVTRLLLGAIGLMCALAFLGRLAAGGRRG